MNAPDPFASESTPSVSFKGAPVGASFTLVVVEAPSVVQSRDFETGKPASWPDGNPKMSVVTKVVNQATGETLSLWAAKPSSMFAALAEATKATGRPLEVGGTIVVTYTGDKPNDNPRLNAQKLYSATYTPPAPTDAFAAADAWGNPVAAPAAQPAQVAAPPVQQAAPVAQPVAQPAAAPGQPTPEQIAALRSAGIDPATVYPQLATAGQSTEPQF